MVGRAAVVVVGGGISGLAAAWELSARLPGEDVVLLEGSPVLGGKLRTATLRTGDTEVTLDVGAESTLARRPEGVALIREAGLGDDLVHPAVASASVLARGRPVPMPTGTVMGVPRDPAALRDLLSDDEMARAAAEATIPAVPHRDDVSVGDWVAERFGPAVSRRLVEPLLGGVYAGHADRLSLRATVPQLWPLAQDGGPVTGRLPEAPPSTDPVFAGIRGGVGRLPAALAAGLTARGVRIRTGTTVRSLEQDGAGWRLTLGPVPAPEHLHTDAVVLAVPPAPTARLLADVAPAAAAGLAGIGTASVVVIAALVDAGVVPPGASGLLVPPVEGRLVKAATYSSSKWAWLGGSGLAAIRLSVGRAGEEQDLQRQDDDLAAAAFADLAGILGRPVEPVGPGATLVQRWGGALPQYAVGHVDRVAAIRAAVVAVAGLEVCGAAYDGVGIPACIATGRAAARGVVDHLAGRSAPTGRMGS